MAHWSIEEALDDGDLERAAFLEMLEVGGVSLDEYMGEELEEELLEDAALEDNEREIR